ncbi:hypothetical protein T12_9249 [Trichinella patagoniensis]|uniref:Uncharacterized protein n=1 Tax=Trichinella patagoniensis TaxID=990121 RepID=A0A0V1A387_9BILA|nr:hypothetical protein T12_9249 [Trichinella patagoniensis]
MFTSILQRELKRALVAYASEAADRMGEVEEEDADDDDSDWKAITTTFKFQSRQMFQCSKENDRQATTIFFWIVIILIFEEEVEGLSKLLWIF